MHVQGPRSLSPGNDGRRISNSTALSGRGSDIAVEAGSSLSAGSEFWTAQEKEQHVLGEIVGFSTIQCYRLRVEEFAFRLVRHLHKTDNAFYSKTFNRFTQRWVRRFSVQPFPHISTYVIRTSVVSSAIPTVAIRFRGCGCLNFRSLKRILENSWEHD